MTEEKTAASWWLYLLRTGSGSLYCGVSTDVSRRLQEHQAGGLKGAKALRGKGELVVVFTYLADSKREAMQLEWQVKRWPKVRKEALIRGEIALPNAEKTPEQSIVIFPVRKKSKKS
jgi:putative endonuclease